MQPQVLSVTTPATDLSLLTLPEMRAAVRVPDGRRDVDVKRIGTRVADAIVTACKVATDGAVPPTLRAESVVDTFRLNRWYGRTDHGRAPNELVLSRRPIISIASVVEAGITLDPTSYELRAGAGMLLRLFGDTPTHWVPSKIVVTYSAGWAIVPEGLKRAAEKMMRLYWSEASRDPLLKSVDIPGVENKTYWIGGVNDPSIPQDVLDDLGPYINPLIG